jgi:hypothetical protein
VNLEARTVGHVDDADVHGENGNHARHATPAAWTVRVSVQST